MANHFTKVVGHLSQPLVKTFADTYIRHYEVAVLHFVINFSQLIINWRTVTAFKNLISVII